MADDGSDTDDFDSGDDNDFGSEGGEDQQFFKHQSRLIKLIKILMLN